MSAIPGLLACAVSPSALPGSRFETDAAPHDPRCFTGDSSPDKRGGRCHPGIRPLRRPLPPRPVRFRAPRPRGGRGGGVRAHAEDHRARGPALGRRARGPRRVVREEGQPRSCRPRIRARPEEGSLFLPCPVQPRQRAARGETVRRGAGRVSRGARDPPGRPGSRQQPLLGGDSFRRRARGRASTHGSRAVRRVAPVSPSPGHPGRPAGGAFPSRRRGERLRRGAGPLRRRGRGVRGSRPRRDPAAPGRAARRPPANPGAPTGGR